jgi:diguanylate cyclase (GGDEF)-like protein
VGLAKGNAGGISTGLKALCTPFIGTVPDAVCDDLIVVQYRRLHSILPLLCLIIAAMTVAMTIAVMGDLPWWQQLAPPLLIGGSCLVLLLTHRRGRPEPGIDHAKRALCGATMLAVPLGLVAGAWTVNAFTETETYYCMMAPVMIALGALVAANGLISAPRAAIGAMAATLTPVVAKMLMFDNMGIRTMAFVLMLVTLLQGGVVISRFRETVHTLMLQHELNRIAESDSLTGLDNRLAFMRKLSARIEARRPVLLALADLDGFKAANDSHGHHAGDEILAGVASRMVAVAPSAISVARLGGDEFALLFDAATDADQLARELRAVRSTVAMPYVVGGAVITISTCVGTATSAEAGCDVAALMQAADRQLYAEKRSRQERHDLHAVGAPLAGERRRWRD